MKKGLLLFIILSIMDTALLAEGRLAIRLSGGLDSTWYAGPQSWYT